MKPDPLRPFLGMIGIAIGFGLYAIVLKLQQPWQSLMIGSLFFALGVSTWVYAKGERWIQVLGAVLIGFGLVRAFFLHP